MEPNEVTVYTLDARPDLVEEVVALHLATWPAFMNANPHPASMRLLSDLAAWQQVAVRGDAVVAVANTVPLAWSQGDPLPAGWQASIDKALEDADGGTPCSALCALAICISKNHLGQGLGTRMVAAMKDLARQAGLRWLLAPVRPTAKSRYPLIDMADYMRWRRDDGAAFDPWQRVHERQGGTLVDVARDSWVATAPVSDWEQWLGMALPQPGRYVFPEGLSPLEVADDGTATYREDNIWYVYAL